MIVSENIRIELVNYLSDKFQLSDNEVQILQDLIKLNGDAFPGTKHSVIAMLSKMRTHQPMVCLAFNRFCDLVEEQITV